MALPAKERKELVSTALEHLSNVIGASGKAEELVRITTLIVQVCKKLAESVSEPTKTRSTATLAEFVIAAKTIAKDTRAVDSNSLQRLSITKRAVEALVKEVEHWHISHCKIDDVEILSQLVTESPPSSPLTDVELKLLSELNRQRVALNGKKDPQKAPEQHGQPEHVLKTTSKGLERAADTLMNIASQKSPRKDLLLDSTILLAKMVSMLLDLVDSLFVTKYPMRAQVHTFCCTLIDDGLAYKDQPKTADAATLKDISTQTPALMSAAEVMTDQCYKRSQNIKENQQMSLQRNSELYSLDKPEPGVTRGGSPGIPRRKPMEAPKPKPKEPEVVDFDICCMICTNVAVDKQSDKPIAKGTEITFRVASTTRVRDVRRLLNARTGISFDHIEVKFQGDDVLADDLVVTPDNPVPYFMFNLCEPGDEELKEIRKTQRRKNLLKIEEKDWWRKVTSSTVAVALYDYEALGEDGNLEFDEGDIVEIVEKSADGWWTGRMGDERGVFPASFVEEVEVPRSKDEQKKLLKKFRQGKLVGGVSDSQIENISPVPDSEHLSSHASEGRLNAHSPVNSYGRSSPKTSNKGFMRVQSATYDISSTPVGSQSPTGKKLSRLASDPSLSHFDSSSSSSKFKEKGGKRLSLFNKKKEKPVPIIEDKVFASHGRPRSPLLSSPSPDKKKRQPFPDVDLGDSLLSPPHQPYSPQGGPKPLVRPASSPRMTKRKFDPNAANFASGSSVASGGGSVKPQLRRPPPPVPKPYKGTDVTEILRKRTNSLPSEESLDSPTSPPLTMHAATTTTSSPLSPNEDLTTDTIPEEEEIIILKPSGSMEELMRNLEEFTTNELSSTTSLTNGHKEPGLPVDYGTIPEHEIPAKKETKPEKTATTPVPPPPSESIIPPVIVTGSPSPSPKPERESPPLPAGAKGPMKPPRSKQRRGTVPEATAADSPTPERRATDPPPATGRVSEGAHQTEQATDTSTTAAAVTQPKAPPRTKKGRTKRMTDKIAQVEKERNDERATSPKVARKKAPPPPPKPKELKATLLVAGKQECSSAPVSRTASPEDASVLLKEASALLRVGGRLEKNMSASSGALQTALEKNQSPVVYRKTTGLASVAHVPEGDDSLDDCTGMGKEGVLHKESSSSREWRGRYFRLLDWSLVYYEGNSWSEDLHPLGELLLIKMKEAVRVGEKNGFQCFAIHMRDDTSVVLGCYTEPDMIDWVRSITKMIKMAPMEISVQGVEHGACYYKAALKCISYLSEAKWSDQFFVSAHSDQQRVRQWLEQVDYGQDADLSAMPDGVTAVTLLCQLLDKARLGPLVPSALSQQLCGLVSSADPVSVLSSKLEKLPADITGLLRQLLRLFGQVLERDQVGLSKLSSVFAALMFEKLNARQSEQLLGYFISTCELVFI